MPLKSGRLTPQEREFVEHYSATGDREYAGTKAGYRQPVPRARELLAKPHLVAEIHKSSLAKIRGEVLPLAVARHMAVLQDPKVTGQALNRAIEMAYKYGLAQGADLAQKDASEMTAEELAEAIATLKRAAEEAARPTLELEAIPEESVFD